MLPDTIEHCIVFMNYWDVSGVFWSFSKCKIKIPHLPADPSIATAGERAAPSEHCNLTVCSPCAPDCAFAGRAPHRSRRVNKYREDAPGHEARPESDKVGERRQGERRTPRHVCPSLTGHPSDLTPWPTQQASTYLCASVPTAIRSSMSRRPEPAGKHGAHPRLHHLAALWMSHHARP